VAAAGVALGVTVAVASGGKEAVNRAAAQVNMNCTLVVPANPLTAQGLATPYQLTATDPAAGPCNEANGNQSAFVQGAVVDPATGQVSVYDPLVIDQGTQAAVAPAVPVLPANAVVGLWFGFNGTVLTLQNPAAAAAAPAAGASAAATPTAAVPAVPAASPTAAAAGAGAAASPTAAAPVAGAASPTAAAAGASAAATPTAAVPASPTAAAAAGGAAVDALAQGNCVNGAQINGALSIFGQFAYCNAPAFFQAANNAIAAGQLAVPNPGTATDGQACETTRNFALIDQDQSDNVTSEYLANGNGQTAQATAAAQQQVAGATALFNASDNLLLDKFVDPALGCTPWTAPDLASPGATATALPLDELQAAAFPAQPTALVPENDPMVLDGNGNVNTDKTSLYRAGSDQTALPAGQGPGEYCGDMESIQGVRLQQDVNLYINQASPVAGAASNLFTFLAMRLQQSFTNLNCQNFGLQNDVSVTTDGNGVVVAACFLQQVNAVTAGAGNPTKGMTVCPATTAAASPTASASASPTAAAGGTASASPSPGTGTVTRRRHHRGHLM